MTVVDIMVYCELETLVCMTREKLPAYYSYLSTWYDTISKIEAVKEVNAELAKVVEEFQLYE